MSNEITINKEMILKRIEYLKNRIEHPLAQSEIKFLESLLKD